MNGPGPARSWRGAVADWLGLARPMPGGDLHRRRLGLEGERAAAKFLRRAGYRIVQRSVRVPIGEADLVCLAPDRLTVVLIEVKTRAVANGEDDPLYAPEAAITADKRRKLAAIGRWLSKANGWDDRPMRIDAVAVEWPANGRKPTVRHLVAVAPMAR